MYHKISQVITIVTDTEINNFMDTDIHFVKTSLSIKTAKTLLL